MKKTIIINVCAFIVGFFIGLFFFHQYDANRDGKVNAQDYVVIKNYIMEKESDK